MKLSSPIAELLNKDLGNTSQIVREAMLLYAAVQKGEVPPQLVAQWRRWAKAEQAELARGVADVVLRELEVRSLVIAGGVPPAVRAEVNRTMIGFQAA